MRFMNDLLWFWLAENSKRYQLLCCEAEQLFRCWTFLAYTTIKLLFIAIGVYWQK